MSRFDRNLNLKPLGFLVSLGLLGCVGCGSNVTMPTLDQDVSVTVELFEKRSSIERRVAGLPPALAGRSVGLACRDRQQAADHHPRQDAARTVSGAQRVHRYRLTTQGVAPHEAP